MKTFFKFIIKLFTSVIFLPFLFFWIIKSQLNKREKTINDNWDNQNPIARIPTKTSYNFAKVVSTFMLPILILPLIVSVIANEVGDIESIKEIFTTLTTIYVLYFLVKYFYLSKVLKIDKA